MLEVCRDVDFAREALCTHGLADFRAQHLHGHLPVVLRVHGSVHSGHAAAANFSLHYVAIGQDRPAHQLQIHHLRTRSST